jgi:glyoxylate/hydroxypyruvate reductase
VNILLLAPQFECSDTWRIAMAAAAPDVAIVADGDVDSAVIEGALVDEPPPGRLQYCTNLRFILSLSAGVDSLLADPTLPAVPIVRLVNTEMSALMREYIVYQVLRLHRRFDETEALQRDRRWVWLSSAASAASRVVSVLGVGHLGRPAAEALQSLGFQVRVWSRTPKQIPGIRCFTGIDGLHTLLAGTDILVSVLPLTPDTMDILSEDLFRRLPVGASIINVGRGACLREDDLLNALDSGHLAHATLDVFAVEPLPDEHPLWRHPRVTITPHTAAYPEPESFVKTIATALTRIREGDIPTVVDRLHGY